MGSIVWYGYRIFSLGNMTDNSNTKRPTWDEYFMMAAKLVATMATCPKRHVGTVIVKNRRILSSGFNGAPPGHPHCDEVGCLVLEGEGDACRRIIHSEHNAVLQDSRNIEGGILYTPYLPCIDCMKVIISAKIAEVVYETEEKIHKDKYKKSKDFAAQSGIKIRQLPEVDIIEMLSQHYGPVLLSGVNSQKKEGHPQGLNTLF